MLSCTFLLSAVFPLPILPLQIIPLNFVCFHKSTLRFKVKQKYFEFQSNMSKKISATLFNHKIDVVERLFHAYSP